MEILSLKFEISSYIFQALNLLRLILNLSANHRSESFDRSSKIENRQILLLKSLSYNLHNQHQLQSLLQEESISRDYFVVLVEVAKKTTILKMRLTILWL